MKISIRSLIGVLLSFNALISGAKGAGELNRDEREIEMAESALFWSRIATVSSFGRSSCESNALACSDDRADLGLALIGEKRSVQSLLALASVSRFRKDGALSENYACYVLSKGRIILPELKSVNAMDVEKKCRLEFDVAKKGNQRLFDGVSVGQICSSSKEISDLMSSLTAGIESGKKCSDGDF